MANLFASITIDRPVQEIFSFISDYHNDWKWRSRRIDFQKLNDSDPTKFTATQKYIPFVNPRTHSRIEVIGFSANEYIISQIQFGKILVIDERRFFSPDTNLTRLEYRLKIEFSGIFKILEQLFTRRLSQDIIADLEWLKEMLEKLNMPRSMDETTVQRQFLKAEINHLIEPN
jgi:hypothetical protein